MAFESGVAPGDWKSAVILPLYKGKGERSECKNYRGIRRVNREPNARIRAVWSDVRGD